MAEVLMKAGAFVAVILMGNLLRRAGYFKEEEFLCPVKDRTEDYAAGRHRVQFFRCRHEAVHAGFDPSGASVRFDPERDRFCCQSGKGQGGAGF